MSLLVSRASMVRSRAAFAAVLSLLAPVSAAALLLAAAPCPAAHAQGAVVGLGVNPVAAEYGADAYPWTGEIRWQKKFNVQRFGAAPDGVSDSLPAIQKAIAAAHAAGGGVVFFPAGTYYVGGSVVLKSGVVLRGAPQENLNVPASAKIAGYAPPSRLEFPRYSPTFEDSGTPNDTAFKVITTESPNTDSNIGVVNLDVNRAAIKLTGDGLTNTNRNVLVFGVRTNNVAEPDPSVPRATHTYTQSGQSVTVPFQEAWQRWSYRFAANVKVQAHENVLVANTRHNDNVTDNFEQPGYKIRDNNTIVSMADPGQAVFNYTNHYGIEVNRSKSGGYSLAGTPATEPSLFRPGIVVRDNWVFHTMRIGITASGDGLVIKDNVVRDQSGKVAWVDATGQRLVGNSATLENRIIDWAGLDVSITGNDGLVYRHLLKTGPYLSVDGEGILIQECCGGSLVNGVLIENNTVNSYIGLYKTRDINNAVIRGNTLLAGDGFGIYVQADTNGKAYRVDNVTIENNTLLTGSPITLTGNVGGSNNVIRNNAGPAGGTHAIEVSASLAATGTTLENNTNWVPARVRGLAAADVTPTGYTLRWNDASENGVDETGYELQQRNGTSNDYTTVATLGADVTEHRFSDLPAATASTFRLRAINDNGAGAYTSAVTVRTTGFTFVGSTSLVTLNRPSTGSVNRTATVRVNWGSSEPVDLDIAGLPDGVTATLSQDPVGRPANNPASTNVTLTLNISSTATKGAHDLAITGTSSAHAASHTLRLTIN